MPSPKAVLADITQLGLNPNVKHSMIKASGRLAAHVQHTPDVVLVPEQQESVKPALIQLPPPPPPPPPPVVEQPVDVTPAVEESLAEQVVVDAPDEENLVVSEQSSTDVASEVDDNKPKKRGKKSQ